MASNSFPCSPVLSLKPFSRPPTIRSNKNMKSCRKTVAMRRKAYNYDYDHHHDHDHYNYYSRLVDENMIVLRKRIHETKMVEENYEPPTEWMGWEKRIYSSYDSIICDAMGLLQSYLMEIRPGMALAMIALITFSVPTSTAIVMSHLLELTKGLL